MTRKWNLALTYEQKIEAVKAGTCRQTIRPVGKSPRKKEGDLVSFHGWQGRPYHSSWSWRTPYTPLKEVWEIDINPEGLSLYSFDGMPEGINFWNELNNIAALDGIVPPTGEALRDVLMSKNKIPAGGIEAQILRW